MQLSTKLALGAFAAAGLVVWAGLGGGSLQASGRSLTALADADGDGLDDALELRLHTNPALADSEGDGYTDLEELLLGADPLLDEGPLQPRASYVLDIYALGPDFAYLQLFFLYRQGYGGLVGVRGQPGERPVMVPGWYLRMFAVENANVASPAFGASGWRLGALTLRLPRAELEQKESCAVGFRTLVDGVDRFQQVLLTHVDGHLVQVREREALLNSSTPGGGAVVTEANFSQTSGQGGGEPSGVGGLSPVDPGDPPTGTQDQVCVQLLVQVGWDHGQAIYQVVDANCEAMVEAVCFSSCAATVGTTITVIDVVGLLGG